MSAPTNVPSPSSHRPPADHSPATTSARAADPFSRSGFGLPRGLREEAASLSMAQFADMYSAAPGPVRLRSIAAARAGGGRYAITTALSIGETLHRATTVAYGPVEAVTELLYRSGVHVEILSFHQLRTESGIATFVRARTGARTAWAYGHGNDGIESTAKAIVAGANRTFAP